MQRVLILSACLWILWREMNPAQNYTTLTAPMYLGAFEDIDQCKSARDGDAAGMERKLSEPPLHVVHLTYWCLPVGIRPQDAPGDLSWIHGTGK